MPELTFAKCKILLADDNASFVQNLLSELSVDQFEIDVVQTLGEAKRRLERSSYDIAVFEIQFENSNAAGFEFLPFLKSTYPETLAAVLTKHDDLISTKKAWKQGASDFISKSLNSATQISARLLALHSKKLLEEDESAKIESILEQLGIAAQSAKTMQLYREAYRYRCAKNVPVLICGETGTGKELLAEFIGAKDDKSKPFIVVNSGSITKELTESEFFGHAKGSFTGAIDRKIGLFEQANGGTIVLDEVARLPLSAQASLLRTLDKMEIRAVGTNVTRNVSFRLICATNEDLDQLVAEGKFRADLLARISGKRLTAPPLRERREEIIPLVKAFLKKDGRTGLQLSPEIPQILESLPWMENARQLRQTVRAMTAHCQTNILTIADLPEELLELDNEREEAQNKNNVIELSFSHDVTLEAAEAQVFISLLDVAKKRLGNKATQEEIASALNMSISTFQRKLRAARSDIRIASSH